MKKLIEFDHVHKQYGKGKHVVSAVQDASFAIRQGEVFGLVGESGSGKSTLGKICIGLEAPTAGTITYLDASLWNRGKFSRKRSGEIQIVFQDPQSSLDSRMTVKEIILEPLYALRPSERKERGSTERFHSLIRKVGLNPEHLSRYPHEFSGGQRQRIAIARALVTDPAFVVLDEPTSALDVSVQAQVLNLLKELRKGKNLTYLFISHNISVIRYMCDRVAVMYKGKIVEIGPAPAIFEAPCHPYTRILLSSLPSIREKRKSGIHFAEPKKAATPDACIFYEKCPTRTDKCLQSPPLTGQKEGHVVACHYAEGSRNPI
ncbi:oligopeptide/dipeptide ABC transporter ATP-binding protein [Paenactinomyces guangxiensis]|uniref:ABC transporter ATP-binding protein n=1 Tax=Paenactinomyces guangxiensis TaxID=1490290 RepID=A0A7W1WUC9_9BACL|nr:oligopeptide/dipeptide ABC transporter ATP-binding protein [Paenactinomyces guangxiensis]MBA4496230.1 ABC transporter ATP-binding protein [Paenactinomyces guangxiensis]MBH8593665.1 ABC transporter ATP-binding protein [Paenactinomyces guangxiensis]